MKKFGFNPLKLLTTLNKAVASSKALLKKGKPSGSGLVLNYIQVDPKLKPEKASKVKIVKLTEADHLGISSAVIQSAYENIKTELLKEDSSIEFNPKQYYISMRKKKNIAFFQIGRKRMSIVVLNQEEDTRLQVQHHEIRMLTEKVQKFWNGPSCTIVIDNMDNLDEVINLLKKLIHKQG